MATVLREEGPSATSMPRLDNSAGEEGEEGGGGLRGDPSLITRPVAEGDVNKFAVSGTILGEARTATMAFSISTAVRDDNNDGDDKDGDDDNNDDDSDDNGGEDDDDDDGINIDAVVAVVFIFLSNIAFVLSCSPSSLWTRSRIVSMRSSNAVLSTLAKLMSSSIMRSLSTDTIRALSVVSRKALSSAIFVDSSLPMSSRHLVATSSAERSVSIVD
jgi:hypothetical protein